MDNLIGKYKNNIIYIKDKNNNNNIDISLVEIINEKNKYSNTNIPIYKIKINNNIISRNNNYKICYKCLECDREQIINLNGYIKKINKNITKCRTCKENDDIKNHSISMRNDWKNKIIENKSINNKNKIISCKDIIEKSKIKFNEMDNDYIDNYFTKKITNEEYEKIKKDIISIQNNKFNDINDFIYYPYIIVNNQTKFSPKLYDIKRDVFECPINIKYKCENCDNNFINKDLSLRKNKIKLYCQDCTLCNRIFKIKNTKNLYGEKITYQSKFELKFIDFCNKNNIHLIDGPKIKYKWKSIERRYIVDFYIPELNWLIELKDEHIWHKKQIENGIWEAKMNSVNELIRNKEYYEYLLIFPKNYQDKIKYILNKI